MWNARKFVPKVPPILLGIAVGCALYYLGQLVGLGDHLGPVVASGERAPMGPTIFPYLMDLKHSEDLLALTPTIFGGAVALAISASIDALARSSSWRPERRGVTAIACYANSASRTWRPGVSEASPAASISAPASPTGRSARVRRYRS